jgi:hypothetical protein
MEFFCNIIKFLDGKAGFYFIAVDSTMAGVLPLSYKLPMMPSNLSLAFLTGVGLQTMQTSFFLEINRSAVTWLDLESSAAKSIGDQWIHSGGTIKGGFEWM